MMNDSVNPPNHIGDDSVKLQTRMVTTNGGAGGGEPPHTLPV